jgi:hypothetical protein
MTEGADDRCPNCLRPEERASHLNLCPSLLRTRQFMESVADLEKWLAGDHTHPEISFWVPRYLKARARTTFCDLINYAPRSACISMSSQMKALALSQDNIGWTHMLEGKISGHFRTIQSRHLRQRNARINGQDWVKMFITRLLKISHTQWIFRNLTLHDRNLGHLAQLRREELASELERLHSLDPDDVPRESQFLLDFDIDDLAEGDVFRQEQWIIAMRAARRAGMRARGRSRRWSTRPRRLRRRHDPPLRAFRPPDVAADIRNDAFGDLLPTNSKRPSESQISLLKPSNKHRRRKKKEEIGHPS